MGRWDGAAAGSEAGEECGAFMAGLYLPTPEAGCDEAARGRLLESGCDQGFLQGNARIAAQKIMQTI
jgi:hypothetical protein